MRFGHSFFNFEGDLILVIWNPQMFLLVGGFNPNWKYMVFVKIEIISPQNQDKIGI